MNSPTPKGLDAQEESADKAMAIRLSLPWFQLNLASSDCHAAKHLWNHPRSSRLNTLMDDGSHFWSLLKRHSSSHHLQMVLPPWIPYASPLIYYILARLILFPSYLRVVYRAMVCKQVPWSPESPWE